MNKKYLKIINILSTNCRTPIKEISREIKSSQQSTSYLLKMVRKKYLKGFTTVVDAVKLGYTNVIVGMHYKTSNIEKRREIMDYLNKNNSIISIQEVSYGVDILLEYCSSNLSAFNKAHIDLLKNFQKEIKTKFVYPIIVKHKYNKNYFSKKQEYGDIVICGDREKIILSENEQKLVYALVKEPTATYTKLAKITKISIKTIIRIKKKLEHNKIIKKYSCYLNIENTNVKRSILFIKPTDINDLDKIPEYANNSRNIVEVTKIIGEYPVMMIIESIDQIDILKELRRNFDITDYKMINIENIKKESFLPLPED